MIVNRIFFSCIAVIMFLIPAQAQEDCSFILTKAQKMYDAGVIEQIPEMLKPCLKKGFSSEESVQAYKLIISSYLFNGNKQEAENTMLEFLRKNPEYEITPTDQAEFVQLFQSFVTLPIAAIGVIAGGNLSYPAITEPISVNNMNGPRGSYSGSNFGFHAGISYSHYLRKDLYLNGEVIYVQNNFEYKYDGDYTVTYTESQSKINVPITATYNVFAGKKIIPFVRAGFGVSYLIADNATPTTSFKDLQTQPRASASVSVMNNRNKVNFYGVAGLGVKYKIKRGLVFFDLRYNLGFLNQVKSGVDPSKSDDIFYQFYRDSNFNLRNLNFSVGYVFTFYKPRKQ